LAGLTVALWHDLEVAMTVGETKELIDRWQKAQLDRDMDVRLQTDSALIVEHEREVGRSYGGFLVVNRRGKLTPYPGISASKNDPPSPGLVMAISGAL
jgi:hypothetical protein